MDNNRIRENIIKILETNRLEISGNKKFFLKDFNMETIDFKDNETKETIYQDDNFMLMLVGGKIELQTNYSNQIITENWMLKLFKFKKVKDIMNWELNK